MLQFRLPSKLSVALNMKITCDVGTADMYASFTGFFNCMPGFVVSTLKYGVFELALLTLSYKFL